jgi:hypothetical protein
MLHGSRHHALQAAPAAQSIAVSRKAMIMGKPRNGHIPAAFHDYGPDRRASVIHDSNQSKLGQSPLLDPAAMAGSFS